MQDMDTDGNLRDLSRFVHGRFVTNLDRPYKLANSTISIPANVTRLGLSMIVNNLIKAENPGWESEPFEFLIKGELLRMSLEHFLRANTLSVEETLEIQYILAMPPPKEEALLHDDWVSAVDGSSPGFILTGCYDGSGRVWKADGACTHILEGHSEPVTSVSIINPGDGESVTIATASKDQALRLWKFNAEESSKNPLKIRAFKILRGHRASVQSVAAQNYGNMVCSGSWDCTINLWKTDESESQGTIVRCKKRRTTSQAKESQWEGEVVSTLVGHTQCVSSVKWPQRDRIYSASWDHSIRIWDAETGNENLNIFCREVPNCLDIGGGDAPLIAAGGSDPIIRIWDPRKKGTSGPVYLLSSHTSWVTACKLDEKSTHLLSASYDGRVMLWDLRTESPFFVTDSHEDKVLCADWWRGDSMLSGGADSKLRITSLPRNI